MSAQGTETRDRTGATALRAGRSARTAWTATWVVALAAASGLGCAFGELRWNDPLQREISLEDIQEDYTSLVRFGNFKRASSYVDPDFREAFLEQLPSPDMMRFTDFESGAIDINETLDEAMITVTYSYYRLDAPIEKKLVERQQWLRGGNSLSWKVRPVFEGLPPVSSE